MNEPVDGWVALQPQRAFHSLAAQPLRGGMWLGLRRPLFVAFVLACCVTLMAGEPFDPRLVASNLLAWSFVPFCEALGLAAVAWNTRRHIALSRAIDLYFTGHAPWLMWFAALSCAWSLQKPHSAPNFMFYYFGLLAAGTLLVLGWSCYVDFHCLRIALARTSKRALRELLLQRLISWSLIATIFGWAGMLAGIAGRLHPA